MPTRARCTPVAFSGRGCPQGVLISRRACDVWSCACEEVIVGSNVLRTPRENARAFIETRVLWLLRASLLRTRASFTGFVEMLVDLHGGTADRGHDPARFQQHWLLFELLDMLWQEGPATAQTMLWPFDAGHEGPAFRRCLDAVFPVLQTAFHRQHFLEHRCEKCRVPVVTLDAKYGLTCTLCNHREGGAVQCPKVDCALLFGCQELPEPGSQYCADHSALPSSARVPAQRSCRVLRHRDTRHGRRSQLQDRGSIVVEAARRNILHGRAGVRAVPCHAERSTQASQRPRSSRADRGAG